ncbi:heavy-metal-associated domain-containing protein [Streptococcus pseudoporcinus]|uniref:Heavy metal-associated domain protein n=2 Tax=Streptococcus pseudoporcinus TaxID=361101 RepID=G5K8I4_9STRE|nr:heavy metal-associated domain-containing protein [Streptococcus pseudoporcinus]EFR45099.1 heavy metal-associated domain protein [Streptococcus pseudoporcinus SPIN 20026]EHI65505.1 heavy metal-associated domain protein [Streptococcus pseudoporcinus LQ 940-04]VEF94208.1 copper chaperone [Streptococcus pseudoporcinus]VTS15474.1 copper chaperone [Streptococcus pseudoporcinus]
MEKTYKLTGMKCEGCVKTVTEKLESVRGVHDVNISLAEGKAVITGTPFLLSLKRALKGTPFTIDKA